MSIDPFVYPFRDAVEVGLMDLVDITGIEQECQQGPLETVLRSLFHYAVHTGLPILQLVHRLLQTYATESVVYILAAHRHLGKC